MTHLGPERRADIDLAAIRANVERLRAQVAPAVAMAVVKANGYGHGAALVARAALEGGAAWLGVADIGEALALRAAGITAPILAWLHDPTTDFAPAIDAGIDIGVSTIDQLEAIASLDTDAPPLVQLKVETGLSRNGLPPAHWDEAFERAALLEKAGLLRVRGIFSHLANTSAESDEEAIAAFSTALALAEDAGLSPDLRHLASTAAAIQRPHARFDLVRLGIGIYGLSPFGEMDSADLGLRPAMTLRGRIAAVRRVDEGAGVSYDHIWRASAPTTLALIPLGYAEGIPRAASDVAEVWIDGVRHPVRGRIAMDQLVVDVGDAPVQVGDIAVLFGDPARGHPSADDWARWAGTINYEIVTRIGPRVERFAE
ncbi:alanine racemase [Naasia lichenicola]|uniref:Alanine racemase n=1 Tax=Naasia lichenicola TaxID=2565933 RepID=A0A4V6RZ01_9MICO|nr:alanine racemase [Naasia lichenicola]THG29747.1 alanine racemase [Naasia lichenicola]